MLSCIRTLLDLIDLCQTWLFFKLAIFLFLAEFQAVGHLANPCNSLNVVFQGDSGHAVLTCACIS